MATTITTATLNGIDIEITDFRIVEPRPAPVPWVSGETAGSFKFTLTTETAGATAEDIKAAMDAILPRRPATYRAITGHLQMSEGMPMSAKIGKLEVTKAVLWSDLGTTRGPEGENRLRKFVRRGAQLAEVRTRGRTGLRSLKEAVEAAGTDGCFTGSYEIEGEVR